MHNDPTQPFEEKAIGLATLGTVVFCSVTGLGVGAFVQEPALGGLGGAALGILASITLIPPLMREWH